MRESNLVFAEVIMGNDGVRREDAEGVSEPEDVREGGVSARHEDRRPLIIKEPINEMIADTVDKSREVPVDTVVMNYKSQGKKQEGKDDSAEGDSDVATGSN